MKKIDLFTKTLLATSVAFAITPTHASTVRGDIECQQFRDFAENKGKFALDATNVEILDKQGQSVGTVLNDAPMMDFSVVARGNGVATLVEPQYIVSVQHNRGYDSVQFGDHSSNNPDSHHFNYQITNRNNYLEGQEINNLNGGDYHAPRLHKLVTETAPIPVSDETNNRAFFDKEKYTAFVRAGSGTQITLNEDSSKQTLTGPYQFMTGGETGDLLRTWTIGANAPRDSLIDTSGNNRLFDKPLSTIIAAGDSGSGLFGYDSKAGRWVYVASAQAGTDNNAYYVSHFNYAKEQEKQDHAGDVISSGQTLAWTPNGNTSTLSTNGQTLLSVGLFDESLAEREGINNGHWFRPRQDHGKTFTVMGENNLIQLTDNINQGSGAIYFKGDTTVEGLKAGTTWLGAGVSIDKDKTVTWRVHNPTGDRLSKIGEGTLLVQGTGTNAGSISVGDGKVILDQQADSDGNKQAFSEVGIVSGRGTVVLNSKDQVNPDNIYFGFRGGRLDVNGNDLTFNRIQNADSGARIVNHNANQASNVSVKGFTAPKIEDIQLIPWERWSPTNSQTHLYEDRRYGYYILRGRWGTFIPGQPHENLSDENWEFVSKDKEEALALFNARRAERIKASGTNYHTGFNGVLGETDETRGANGELNIAYNPSLTGAKWLLTGGSNLNGTLSAENGTVLMSGRPTPHAYDFIGNKEVIIEGDWQNRSFKATTFEAKTDGKIAIGRNVDTVIGDFKGTGNGEIQAGFTQSKSDACLRSDRTGAVTCDTPTLSDKDLASWERTHIAGRVNLADQSRFTVGSKGHFVGTVVSTDDSTVALDKDAIWTMTGESGVNRLVVDNATINLNANFEQGQSTQYNRLTIGELSGQGTFNYLTDIGQLASDKIVVGNASGDFKLNVKNSGAEPTHNDRLVLLTAEQENNFKVALANPDERVDIGAYRYELIKGEQVYQLYSPKIEQEFLEREHLEKERLEAEKLAKEKAEAERLEREKAEQERLEKERLEKERLAKLEAERLEKERLEKERLEAEKLAREKTEAEKLAREKLEAEKRAEAERLERERLEAEKLAKEKAEAERLEREKAERERLEKERLAKERTQADYISRYTNAGLSEIAATADTLTQLNRNLTTHILAQNSPNIWLAGETGNNTHQSPQYRPFKKDDTLTQIGIKQSVDNSRGTLQLGLAHSYHSSRQAFADDIYNRQETKLVSAFAKQAFANNVFVSADVSAGVAVNALTSQGQTIDFKRKIVGGGINVGKILYAGGVAIEPSVGVRYDTMAGVDYKLNQADIHSDDVKMVSYRAGVKVSGEFGVANTKVKPFLASDWTNHPSTADILVNQHRFEQTFDNTQSHQLGLEIDKQAWTIRVSATHSDGNQTDGRTSAGLSVGYRW